MPRIFKIRLTKYLTRAGLCFGLLLALSSCISTSSQTLDVVEAPSYIQKIFFAPYENVWRAAQLALANYPIAINNIDSGILETEYIKGFDMWTPPESPKQPSAGMQYKLILKISKGRSQGRASARVTVTKKIEVKKDFFSEPQPLKSDLLEEKLIVYRIDRELLIENAIMKSAHRSNEN